MSQKQSGTGHRRWLRLALELTVAVLVAGAGVYVTGFSRVPVSAYRADIDRVVAEVTGTGTLEARLSATISPKIQGRLIEVAVDQNDRVRTGQVLARLDDNEWRELVGGAAASVEAAMATVERARADEARAQAVLSRARSDHRRARELPEADIVSRSDFDLAIEPIRVAEAELTQSRAAVKEADRQKRTAHNNLACHQARLTETQMVSPFDGLVVRRDRGPGDLVVSG